MAQVIYWCTRTSQVDEIYNYLAHPGSRIGAVRPHERCNKGSALNPKSSAVFRNVGIYSVKFLRCRVLRRILLFVFPSLVFIQQRALRVSGVVRSTFSCSRDLT